MKHLAYLYDVAVGAFGVGANEDGEEGRGAVVSRHHAQDLLEVFLVPGLCEPPASCLEDNNKAFLGHSSHSPCCSV